MRIKFINTVITVLFAVHFVLVSAYLCAGVWNIAPLKKVTAAYITPFFDQSWSMFSAPGKSNRAVHFQYRLINSTNGKTYETDWLDINKPLRTHNSSNFFSLSQRLIKYTSGCINSIYLTTKIASDSIAGKTGTGILKLDTSRMPLIQDVIKRRSAGYKSLLLYAGEVFRKQDIPNKEQYDSVTVALRIFNDELPPYNRRNEDFSDTANHVYTSLTISHEPLNRKILR